MIGRRLDSIDLDTIVYGYLRGTPASEMAEVIGCHIDTVRKNYKRLREAFGDGRRIKHAPWPDAVRRRSVQRYRDGESVIDIAKDIGADRTLVYYWIRKERDG